MGQEWDYPPRQWRAERTRADRFGPIIDHEPRPRTAWQWYSKQMRAKAPMLHKANITALFFTLSGAFYLAIGVGSALLTWIIAKVLF